MRFAIIFFCLALGACDIAPPRDRQAEAEKKAAERSPLYNAVQQPIDRAKTANDPNLQHDKDQEQAIKDAGG